MPACRKEGTVERKAVEGEQTATGMQKETVGQDGCLGWHLAPRTPHAAERMSQEAGPAQLASDWLCCLLACACAVWHRHRGAG